MKKLKYLFFIIPFLFITNVHAMDANITPSGGSWYNNSNQVVASSNPTTRYIAGEPYFQFQGNNNLAQFLTTDVYFDESINNYVLSNRWDVSFTILSYGDYNIRLGTSSCFITSSISVGDFSANTSTGDYQVDESYYSYKNVFCPNVQFNSLPVKLRLYRTFSSGTYTNNRLLLTQYWSLSQTNNEFSTQDIIVNDNQNTQDIIDSQQDTTDAINGLNDNITSEADPNTSSSISDMNGNVASDTPITDLITMPLTLMNAYINGINGSCSSYSLGNLLGTNLSLPCINIQNIIGSELWSIIDVLVSIFLIFNISKLFISAFDNITSLKDDFNTLYGNDYQPKHGGGE